MADDVPLSEQALYHLGGLPDSDAVLPKTMSAEEERDLLGRQVQSILEYCQRVDANGGGGYVRSDEIYRLVITDPADERVNAALDSWARTRAPVWAEGPKPGVPDDPEEIKARIAELERELADARELIDRYETEMDTDAYRLAAGIICAPGQSHSCGDAHHIGRCYRPTKEN